MKITWKCWILFASLAGCWNEDENPVPPEPVALEVKTVFDEFGADDVALSADEHTLVTCSRFNIRILDADTLTLQHVHTSRVGETSTMYSNSFCRAAIIGNDAYFYWGDNPKTVRLIKQSLITRDEVWSQWLPVPEKSAGLYDVVSPHLKQSYQGIVPTSVANRALFILGLNKVYPADAEWSGIEPLYLDLATGELSRERALFLAGVETVDIIGAFGGTKIFGNITYHSNDGAAPNLRGFILDLESKDYQETPPHEDAFSRFVDEPSGIMLSVEPGLWVTELATGEILHRLEEGAGLWMDVVPAGAGQALFSYDGNTDDTYFRLVEYTAGNLIGKGSISDHQFIGASANGMAASKARDRVWLATADSISILEIPPADAGSGE